MRVASGRVRRKTFSLCLRKHNLEDYATKMATCVIVTSVYENEKQVHRTTAKEAWLYFKTCRAWHVHVYLHLDVRAPRRTFDRSVQQ